MTAAEYTLDLCARIAAHTDVSGSITRTFLSPATHAVHRLLRAEMEALGMTVRMDSVGNLRGFYAAATPTAPILLLGSHIDTVPDAGAYDGILGVALPIALLRSLEGKRLAYAIELIAFSEEEGIRFKLPFIGSRALIGDLGPTELARTDANGTTLVQAIDHYLSGAPSQTASTSEVGSHTLDLTDALLTPDTFAFLEVHIEQGPILDSLEQSLGVVDTIVGQSRFELTFTGQANHAGTTPMHLRRDALAAAAAWMLHVEQFARDATGLVATIGSIHAHPGAANVIPGKVVLSLDVRHAFDATRTSAASALLVEAAKIATSRSIGITLVETSQQAAVAMNQRLRDALLAAAPGALQMPSGAGHDAMILARKVPAAMLFVRSPGGISHHPSESVRLEDLQAALAACRRFLNALEPTTLSG